MTSPSWRAPVLGAAGSLLAAGVIGLWHLSHTVTRLTVQVEALERAIGRLEQSQVYYHGGERRP